MSTTTEKSIKSWPTLYKRTRTGAIQYWIISTHTDRIGKESGQLGTNNPITHSEIVKGKNIGRANETTPNQQAELQAESDWKKKRDEGYKSLEDLNITEQKNPGDNASHCWSRELGTNKADVPYYGSIYDVLDKALPQFNTDASGNVKPMLAKAVNWAKVTYPCYIQPKLDGVRCLMIVDEDGVNFLSRSGKPYTTLNHIATDVRGYVLNNPNPVASFILDGEIYSDELTFQDIVSAVKKRRPDSLKLHFRAYDVVNEEKQTKRRTQVKNLIEEIDSPLISEVPTMVALSRSDVKFAHDEWVQKGYEGAMIRLYDGHYGQGQRSSHLLKVKEFDDTEFIFVGFETGQREEDLIAVCATKDKKQFRAKMQGSREQKIDLKENWDNLRAWVTVKHFGWTDDKLPRFPVGKAFRDYE